MLRVVVVVWTRVVGAVIVVDSGVITTRAGTVHRPPLKGRVTDAVLCREGLSQTVGNSGEPREIGAVC